jgi:hypothetical protein
VLRGRPATGTLADLMPERIGDRVFAPSEFVFTFCFFALSPAHVSYSCDEGDCRSERREIVS